MRGEAADVNVAALDAQAVPISRRTPGVLFHDATRLQEGFRATAIRYLGGNGGKMISEGKTPEATKAAAPSAAPPGKDETTAHSR